MGGRGGVYDSKRRHKNNYKTTEEAMEHILKSPLMKDEDDGRLVFTSESGKEIPPEVANQIADAVDMIVEKFPQMKGILDSMALTDEYPGYGRKTWGNIYACCMGALNQGAVSFNPARFTDPEKFNAALRSDVESGFHPPGTDSITACVVHEIAHAIDGNLALHMPNNGSSIYDMKFYVSDKLQSPAMHAAGEKNSYKPTVEKTVSRYGATDKQEWFAEAFSEYVCSPNPRPVAMTVGNAVKQMLNGDYSILDKKSGKK